MKNSLPFQRDDIMTQSCNFNEKLCFVPSTKFYLKTYVIFCPAIKLSKRKPLVLYLYLNTSNYAQKYFYIHKNDENLANLCFNLSHVPNKLIQERKLSNDIITKNCMRNIILILLFE